MEYDKIELDSDKDTILLYKNSHARPRFMALHTLVSETKKQDN
jgi:hypothetical protein